MHISTSVQNIIFPSGYTANTRLFRLVLLNRCMAPSDILPQSNRVTTSLRQTTQETPLSADTLPRLGKVSPYVLLNLSSIDDISQMHLQPFDLPSSLTASSHRVQPTVLRSTPDSSSSAAPARSQVFRSFAGSILPRRLWSQTRRQTLGHRILVLREE